MGIACPAYRRRASKRYGGIVTDAQQLVALDAALLRRLSSYWFFTSHPAIIAATSNAHQAQIKLECTLIPER
jgi:hypothetical protein